MREWLYELRKKADKTQNEVSVYLKERLGLSVTYGQVEQGIIWKDLSGAKSEALADILGTTPEHICECDRIFGGYQGLYHSNGYQKFHKVSRAQYTQYRKPMSEEEKLFAIEWLPYAENAIKRLRYTTYRCFYGTILTEEDYYDLGILGFLLGIKIFFNNSKTKEIYESIEAPEEKTIFIKRHLFKKIKQSLYRYIKSEKRLYKKDYYNSLNLDEQLDDSREKSAELYNFVPDNGISGVEIAESECFFAELNKYLEPKQKMACKLLVQGWTQRELISKGYITKNSMGRIHFYLQQIKTYGKVLYSTDQYKSGIQDITYDFSTNRWRIYTTYEKKRYCLGSQIDLITAIDLKAYAHYHCNKKDFLDWYHKHIFRQAGYDIFIYPIDADIEEIKANPIEYEDTLEVERSLKTQVLYASKENPIGLFRTRAGSYAVKLGTYDLGTYKSFDEAFSIRKQAEQHKDNGTFDSWFHESRNKRLGSKKTTLDNMVGITKLHSAAYSVKYNATYIGRYKSREDAVEARKLAEEHAQRGDLNEWLFEYKKQRKNNKTYKSGADEQKAFSDSNVIAQYALFRYVADRPLGYLVSFYDEANTEHILCETPDADEAVSVMDTANDHIEAGDFDVWFAEYKKSK